MSILVTSRANPKSALAGALPVDEQAPAPRTGRCGWAITLSRIRLADRLQPPGRFALDAADSDWLLLAVILEGSGHIASPEGARAVAAGEAVVVPPGQAATVHTPRWTRLLLVGGLVAALPAAPPRTRVVRHARPTLEQIAHLGRNARAIAAILERFPGSAFDAAVDESVFALLDEILWSLATKAVSDTD